MLSTLERRQQILDLTNGQGKVHVEELADQFGVSAVTIRSDLNLLADKALVIRSRGGALAGKNISKELSIDEKHNLQHAVKSKLGRAAAKFINDGESIILDSGSTTLEIAKQLNRRRDLVVMTNGLNIASALSNNVGVELLVTGGSLRQKTLSFYGGHAESSFKNLLFDKLFIGVDGIDYKLGLMTHFEHEARLNRLMVENCRQVIAVADSSKFQRRGYHLIADMQSIDILVTDDRITPEAKSGIESAGIELVLVPHPDD